MKINKLVIFVFAVFSMLFWGMSFVWSKVVFQYYSPITTIFLRLLISGGILLVIWFFMIQSKKIDKKDIKLFLISAFFSPFCYFIGESFGLVETSSTIAAVIIATIPVFTPFVAFFMLKEKLTSLNFIGMFISFFGVVVMLLRKDLSLNASPIGIGLLAFAVLAAVSYGITVKKLSLKYHPITVVTFQNLIGALYFLPFFLLFDLKTVFSIKLNFELVSSLLLLAVFASSLAFILYTTVIREIGISRANIFSNLIPVFTAVFSYIILNEQFTIAKFSGMVLVIIGVVLAQSGKFLNKQSVKQ